MAYVSMLSMVQDSSNMEKYVKAILYGDNGTGKTTSVLAGAPKPILVIDAELRIGMYKNAFDFQTFPSIDPNQILQLTQEMLQLKIQGQPMPWKTVLIDSGSELYRHIKKYALDRERESQKNPSKTKLEFNEWDLPKGIYYEILDNLKNLPVHLYMTAHEQTNYLPNQVMKPDPLKPTKPRLEGSAAHHFDIVAHYEKKGNKYKVTFEKNCVLNKEGQQVLPPIIDNVNNMEFIKMLHDMVDAQKGYAQPKSSEPSNVIRENAKFESMLDESMTNVATLQWSNDRIVSEFKSATEFDNPDTLRTQPDAEQRIGKFLDVTRQALSNSGAAEFDGVE